MAFSFTAGPHPTNRSVAQIAAAVKEVGQDMRYMSALRRRGLKQTVKMGFGDSSYGPFAPSADDDPFATASAAPVWQVGYRWNGQVTNSWNMTMSNYWQIIYTVHEDRGGYVVTAKAEGSTARKEVENFIKHVFTLL